MVGVRAPVPAMSMSGMSQLLLVAAFAAAAASADSAPSVHVLASPLMADDLPWGNASAGGVHWSSAGSAARCGARRGARGGGTPRVSHVWPSSADRGKPAGARPRQRR
jgi:hypothetical protein